MPAMESSCTAARWTDACVRLSSCVYELLGRTVKSLPADERSQGGGTGDKCRPEPSNCLSEKCASRAEPSVTDVETDPRGRYDAAIVFVHGIGNQAPGSGTRSLARALVKWAEVDAPSKHDSRERAYRIEPVRTRLAGPGATT